MIKKLLLAALCVVAVRAQDDPPPSPVPHKIVVKAKNASATATRSVYIRWQNFNGVDFDDYGYYTQTVAPGATATLTFDSPIDTIGTASWSCDLSTDYADGYAVDKVGASYIINNDTGTYSVKRLLGPVSPVEMASTFAYNVTLKESTVPDGNRALWQTSDETLTANLFREGVDMLYSGQQASAAAAAGAGDPAADSNRELVATGQLLLADTGTIGAIHADASSQTETAVEALGTLFPTAPTTRGFSMPADGSVPSILSVTMPVSFGGGVFDFNPFTEDRLGTPVAWFRAACQWLAYALLAVWLWNQIGVWVRGVSVVPQAKGNPVLAGTGAQGTALLAAAGITLAVVVALTALLGFTFDSMNPLSLLTGVSDSPFAALPGGAYWMLNQLLPVSTLLSCFLAKVSFNVYAPFTYSVCAAVVRFLIF